MHLKRNFRTFGLLNIMHALVKNTGFCAKNHHDKCIHFIWKCKFIFGVRNPIARTYQSSVNGKNKVIKF